jgi:hypothetical protein
VATVVPDDMTNTEAPISTATTATALSDLSRRYTGRAWVEHAVTPHVKVVVTVTHTTDCVE